MRKLLGTPLLIFLWMIILAPLPDFHAGSSAIIPNLSTANDLVNEVNALRATYGLAPYRADPILMSIAQNQADYMASIGTWTHSGPDGSRPYQRALNAGYLVAGDLSLGGFFSENVLMANNSSAHDAVQRWMGDEAHKNTMLSTVYRDAGAGVSIVGNTYYYCLDAGLSTGGTPVAYTPAGPTPAATIVVNTPDPDGSIYHIVQPGDTLSTISAAYGVPIGDILRLNGLTLDTLLQLNQRLVIRLAFTPTPTMPSPTPSRFPTSTPWPTSTASATPTVTGTPTATPLPEAAVTAKSGLAIVGMIILLALIVSGITALLGKRQQ